jgi:hypothetical protein
LHVPVLGLYTGQTQAATCMATAIRGLRVAGNAGGLYRMPPNPSPKSGKVTMAVEERSVFMPEYGYFCMCCREMHIPGYACVESTRYVPAPTPAPKNREGETDTGGGRDEQC